MPWANIDSDITSAISGTLGAVGLLVGALAAAYVFVLKARAASRKTDREQDAEDYVSSLNSWKALVTAHEEQGKIREATMQGMMQVLELQKRDQLRCRTAHAQLKSALYFLNDWCKRLYTAVVAAKGDPGPQLEMPLIDDLVEGQDAAEFLMRQAKQSEQVVRETDEKLREQKATLETVIPKPPSAPKPECKQ